jgi:DNA-binding CsgD family transcriptional regulator
MLSTLICVLTFTLIYGTMLNMAKTTEQVLIELHLLVTDKTQKQVADQLGVSPAYINDLIKGRRLLSAKVAEKLGYRRVVKYERICTVKGKVA